MVLDECKINQQPSVPLFCTSAKEVMFLVVGLSVSRITQNYYSRKLGRMRKGQVRSNYIFITVILGHIIKTRQSKS